MSSITDVCADGGGDKTSGGEERSGYWVWGGESRRKSGTRGRGYRGLYEMADWELQTDQAWILSGHTVFF